MNKYMTIPFVFFSFMSFAQKKFVVEYDRIKDNISYYELSYKKGEYSEKELDKAPVLNRGDVVKFRSLNTNPLVFSFNVDEPEELGEKENVSKSVLSGFSGVMGQIDGAISEVGFELSSLGYNPPDDVSFGRGTENISTAKKASLEQLNTFREHLKWTYQQLEKYQKSMEDVYSTGKTKQQIVDGLSSSAESFEMDDYMDRLRFMEQEYEIIKSDPLLEDVDFSDLEKTYELLDTKLNESPMAPQNAKDLLNMVAAVSFTEETTTVISYESNWSRGRLAENDDDVTSLKYVFDYRSLNETEEGYDDDNLLQSKSIELPMRSRSHFSWSTGFYSVSPFDGFNSYRIQKFDNDSVRVINDDAEGSSRLTLGTSLTYNFPSRFFVIPQLMFGTSIAFLGSGWIKPLNFHIGAGLKFKSFPYLSLVGGVSFSQNQMLRTGTTLNEIFTPDNSYPEIEDYVQSTFSPGYFFGININL